MKSLFSPEYRQGCFIPVVHAYYDRADMLRTTVTETNHAHTLSEIMYVNEGTITVDVSGQRAVVGRKQFIWLDASVLHHLLLDANVPCSVMNIEFQLEPVAPRIPSLASLAQMDPQLSALLEDPVPYMVLTDADGTVYNVIKQVIQLADSTHPEAEALCSWLVGQLLMLMAHCRAHTGRAALPPTGSSHIAAALALIDAQYLQPITVQKIALALHLQPSYLHRLFKEQMGITVGEYINRLRIRQACVLLRTTDSSLLDIAVACGISSQQRMGELFRRITGSTPLEYRRVGTRSASSPPQDREPD